MSWNTIKFDKLKEKDKRCNWCLCISL